MKAKLLLGVFFSIIACQSALAVKFSIENRTGMPIEVKPEWNNSPMMLNRKMGVRGRSVSYDSGKHHLTALEVWRNLPGGKYDRLYFELRRLNIRAKSSGVVFVVMPGDKVVVHGLSGKQKRATLSPDPVLSAYGEKR